MTRNFRRKKTVLKRAKQSSSAAAQSKQIMTLARQVDNLQEATRELSIPTYYSSSYSSRTNAYPLIIPLSSGPSIDSPAVTNNTPLDNMGWIKRFNYGGPSPNETRQNLKLYSQFVDVILEPGNEEDILIHTIFLVKLANDSNQARDTYNATTAMNGMTFGQDYISNQGRPGAQAWLNPERYEIIKRWEFHTVGDEKVEPTPGASANMQNFSGGINRFGFKINYSGRHLRATGEGKEISDIVYNDIEPEHKYFMVAFSDNSTLDLENPLISVSSIVKARMF
ncbi:MAG: putative capsid protein [Circular genetic element sp.]|nr:MAG: putative capsid protein [Circular genetic element sp.]